jgi:mannose-1-phosphate guanylyltransferase
MYYFVILSGGSGSRLWPKSREKLPKQFLKLTNDYTMFQNTLFRVQKIANYLENITSILEYKVLVICNQDHSHIIEYQIKEIEQDYNFDIQIICEPKGRDSAPAICIASLLGNKDDFTFILPCDHIFDDDEFSRCCIDSLKYLDIKVTRKISCVQHKFFLHYD